MKKLLLASTTALIIFNAHAMKRQNPYSNAEIKTYNITPIHWYTTAHNSSKATTEIITPTNEKFKFANWHTTTYDASGPTTRRLPHNDITRHKNNENKRALMVKVTMPPEAKEFFEKRETALALQKLSRSLKKAIPAIIITPGTQEPTFTSKSL